MTPDGYPDDAELDRIRTWPATDGPGLMEYVVSLGWCEYGTMNEDGDTYFLSTGGWSGNEEIISALMDNTLFWSMCWESSARGGKYTFIVGEKK